ncbi:hypothetical protein DFH06DRAFT_1120404 [Mycena polygramma]|nr:hypothetical protein DFH06DRAFT_1120404 [Mycena polygramma]
MPTRDSIASSRRELSAETYRAVVGKIMMLHPLLGQKFDNIKDGFTDTVLATRGLDRARKRLKDTRTRPVEQVFGLPCAEGRVVLILIRVFVREREMAKQNGQKTRPFWGKLDTWFENKRYELGETFATEAWQRFIGWAMREEQRYAPPLPSTIFSVPLHFIHTPRLFVAWSPPESGPTSQDESSSEAESVGDVPGDCQLRLALEMRREDWTDGNVEISSVARPPELGLRDCKPQEQLDIDY